MSWPRFIFVPFVLMFVLICETHSQINEDVYTRFNNIRPSAGLSHPKINDIYQDVNGFIWIGTEDGLHRYDGYRFLVFKNLSGDSTSISNNIITSITGDSLGNLWIGTTNGLNFYDRQTGKFARLLSSFPDTNTLRNNHVRRLALDGNYLWVETVDGTLSKYNPTQNTFRHFSHPFVHQPYYRYHALVPDDTIVWFGGRGSGINFLNINNETITHIPANPQSSKGKRDNDFADILKIDHDRYLVCATDGVYEFCPSKREFQRIYFSSAYSLVRFDEEHVFIGSGNGLIKYNLTTGNYIRYRHDIDNHNSLINNGINRLFLDRDRNLWIGTDDGISVLTTVNQFVKCFYRVPGNNKTLSGNHITDILEDSQGRIGIGTKDQGLNLWDRKRNTFEYFRNEITNTNSITSNNVRRIYEDKAGNLWIGLWSGLGFNKFNPAKGTFQRYAINTNSKKLDWYNDFLEDMYGNFWLGVWGASGLIRFDRETGRFSERNYRQGHIFTSTPFDALVFNGIDAIFIRTPEPVIRKYDLKEKKLKAYCSPRQKVTKPEKFRYFEPLLPFEFDSLRSFASDGHGRTLFATNKGLMLHTHNTGRFIGISIGSENIQAVAYCSTNKSFQGFSQTNILFFDETLKVVKTEKLPESSFSSGRLPSVDNDNTEKPTSVWLSELNPRAKLFDIPTPTIAPVNVGSDIFYATYSTLYRLSLESGQVEKLTVPDETVLSSHLISVLTNDIDGKIWIGTTDAGLNLFDPVTETFRHFIDLENNAPQLPDEITAIHVSKKGEVWVGSQKGLFRYNRIENLFEKVSQQWPSKAVASISESPDSAIWVGVGQFLVNLNPNSLKSTVFSSTDGLLEANFTPAATCLRNGEMLFGTTEGFVLINPSNFKKKYHNRKVVFTALEINGKVVQTSITEGSTLVFQPEQNHFSIDFSSLNYHAVGTKSYSYTLENFDDRWISIESNRLTFSNLKHGKYTLRVVQRGHEGQAELTGILYLHILPPFWKTGWFISIIIFSVLGVAFFVGYQYIKRLKIREQNIIMEHRLLASQMNPHFISNTLTAIQYFVYNNESQKAGNYLSNFSRLIRLILDSSREEYVSLDKELQTVRHYLNLQQLRFVDKFDYKIVVDPKINEKLTYIAPMLSQPFIENSIEHGIMHLKGKGNIDIRYRMVEDNMLEISITDNGVGIRQSKEINSRRETHHSHATAITRQRLVTMGKGRKVKPTIEIVDLTDNQGDSGTCVIIRCPYVYQRKL